MNPNLAIQSIFWRDNFSKKKCHEPPHDVISALGIGNFCHPLRKDFHRHAANVEQTQEDLVVSAQSRGDSLKKRPVPDESAFPFQQQDSRVDVVVNVRRNCVRVKIAHSVIVGDDGYPMLTRTIAVVSIKETNPSHAKTSRKLSPPCSLRILRISSMSIT